MFLNTSFNENEPHHLGQAARGSRRLLAEQRSLVASRVSMGKSLSCSNWNSMAHTLRAVSPRYHVIVDQPSHDRREADFVWVKNCSETCPLRGRQSRSVTASLISIRLVRGHPTHCHEQSEYHLKCSFGIDDAEQSHRHAWRLARNLRYSSSIAMPPWSGRWFSSRT